MFARRFSVAVLAALIQIALALPTEKSFVVPISKRAEASKLSARDLVARDSARHGRLDRRTFSATISNAETDYTADVTIGGQSFTLLLDTGSSNIWVGANQAWTGTGTDLGDTFAVSYGSGTASGEAWEGTVSVGNAEVTSQIFGVADDVDINGESAGLDGFFGVGFTALTAGTVEGHSTVPTFVDNLVTEDVITDKIVGIYLHQETGSDTDDANGEITFGSLDSTKYVSGSLNYFSPSTDTDLTNFWSLDVTGFNYGSTSLTSATSTGAIVDTGTALIYLPTDVYNAFLTASGGFHDDTTGFARWNDSPPTENFEYVIGSVTITLTPTQYLVPEAQYAFSGFPEGAYFAWFFPQSSDTISTVFGQKFLESYFSAYNYVNSEVGLAPRT